MHRSRPRISAWTKDQTCMLIEEIQKHPLLYDQMHPLYQHRAERFEALRSVISNLRPIKPNINEGMITRKLKVLRHQYYNELRRIEDPPEHLLNQQGQYQPSLWCFDLMKFLDKRGNYSDVHVPPKRIIPREPEEIQKKEKITDDEDCNTEEDSNESNDPFEEVEIERINPRNEIYSKKHSPERSVLHNKCLKLVETLSKGLKNMEAHKSVPVTQKHQSAKTFLGLMVESELSTVSEDIYHDAKWKIMRILEEATTKEREKKMRNTSINSSSVNSTATVIPTQNTVDENQVIVRDSTIFKTPMGRNVQIVAMNPNTFDKYIIQQ